MEMQYLHVSNLPVGTHMSGYEPQSQKCIVQQPSTPTPATSVASPQQGSTSAPSMALPGPLSIPHLSPSTPSGDSPFNPYHATLETPTLMFDHLNCKLKPNLAAGHGRAILRKDLKKDHQINMIYEDICSEFYLFALTEHIFTEHGDYKKLSELAHNGFQQLNTPPFEITDKFAVTVSMAHFMPHALLTPLSVFL